MTLQYAPPAEKELPAPRCAVFHVWTTSARAAQIDIAATQFALHPDQMIAAIVDAIVDRDLFTAILKADGTARKR